MASASLVVLGAGRPTGFPQSANSGNTVGGPALPWIRNAASNHVGDCHFVAGYAIEEMVEGPLDFRIHYNSRWRETGSAASLLCVPFPVNQPLLVTYADVVFREEIVRRLLDDPADVAIAIDSRWRSRYTARTPHDREIAEKVRLSQGRLAAIGRDIDDKVADAEFVGLVRLSPKAMSRLGDSAAIPGKLREKGSVADLVGWLALDLKLTHSCHDVEGDWAELNAPQDLARFVLGTKAETLDRLRPLTRVMRIEEQVQLTVEQWDTERDRVLDMVSDAFSCSAVIVRSSSRSEDSWTTANAGAYASVPDVDPRSPLDLASAIEAVIDSYGPRRGADQVLVQPMVRDVIANGVLLTRTLTHGAPYFVVNYDETPGCTDAVTSGTGELHVIYIHHDADTPPDGAPAWVAALVQGARELIGLVGYDTLDMEFVVGSGGTIHLLQLRPIAVDHTQWVIEDAKVRTELEQAVRRYNSLRTPPGQLHAGRPVFGIMPDWNPAEIIGTSPSLLAVSLYRFLICDDVWARQRAEYGYHDVRPQPLLVSFAGRPYVNVRASFRSFLPASLPENLAERLVDHCLSRLIADPTLHDKIEFDIAYTCTSFDFHDRSTRELRPAGFSEEEIEALSSGLAQVTLTGIRRYTQDLETVAVLDRRFQSLMGRSLDPLERACTLLEDCRSFGTLPFAHLARGGFIAITLLRSAVRQGYIEDDFLERYLNSISTVAKNFVRDGKSAALGALSWDEFMDRYGHLRPGTYDITSPTYRHENGKLLRDSTGIAETAFSETGVEHDVAWPDGAWPRMQDALAAFGIDIELREFDRFLRAAIEGREYAKFVFSRNLSQALEDIAEYGRGHLVGRQTLAEIPIEGYFALRAGDAFGEPGEFLHGLADFYEPRSRLSRNIQLPPLIHDARQFFAFIYPPTEPNFITSGALTAEIRCLSATEVMERDGLAGRIVVIEQADPGFDWLFGCGIAGLITQFGGANSHMAIRAAEFGIPAAIGVGKTMFERLLQARYVNLDCLNGKIDILR